MKCKPDHIIIAVLLLLFFTACGKDEYINSVTRVPVNFSVDLVRDHNLLNEHQHKIYRNRDLIDSGEYIESPGIVVFNTGDIYDTGNDFAAYDIRCPFEDRMDRLLVISGTEAVCPSCKANYDLFFGNCTNGITTKPLQSYCITNDFSVGKRLRVRNCN